jgi:hypothetical protein
MRRWAEGCEGGFRLEDPGLLTSWLGRLPLFDLPPRKRVLRVVSRRFRDADAEVFDYWCRLPDPRRRARAAGGEAREQTAVAFRLRESLMPLIAIYPRDELRLCPWFRTPHEPIPPAEPQKPGSSGGDAEAAGQTDESAEARLISSWGKPLTDRSAELTPEFAERFVAMTRRADAVHELLPTKAQRLLLERDAGLCIEGGERWLAAYRPGRTVPTAGLPEFLRDGYRVLRAFPVR